MLLDRRLCFSESISASTGRTSLRQAGSSEPHKCFKENRLVHSMPSITAKKHGLALGRFDKLSPESRSQLMRLIKKKNTGLELSVRKLIHKMGYRYRVHASDLPGTPDIIFRSRRKVIFCHGCLWHGHEGCKLNKPIKARPEYWQPKLKRNKARDLANYSALASQGWEVLIIWECEAKKLLTLQKKIADYLGPTRLV